MDIWDILLAIGISAVTGAIASLIAPWAKWGVEKRKKKLEWRKGFINEVKRYLKESFDKSEFIEQSFYSNLKPHLSQKLVSKLESGKDKIQIQMTGRGEGTDNFKPELLDEINEIEKKWGLL